VIFLIIFSFNLKSFDLYLNFINFFINWLLLLNFLIYSFINWKFLLLNYWILNLISLLLLVRSSFFIFFDRLFNIFNILTLYFWLNNGFFNIFIHLNLFYHWFFNFIAFFFLLYSIFFNLIFWFLWLNNSFFNLFDFFSYFYICFLNYFSRWLFRQIISFICII
jgi:hypothetical protein